MNSTIIYIGTHKYTCIFAIMSKNMLFITLYEMFGRFIGIYMASFEMSKKIKMNIQKNEAYPKALENGK